MNNSEKQLVPFYINLDEDGHANKTDYSDNAEHEQFKAAEEIPEDIARELSLSQDSSREEANVTKIGIEIGHANEVLKKAKALVDEAYALICNDDIAKKHLEFSALVSWSKPVWNKLNEAYAKQNLNSKNIWHWRAFEHFGLEIGMNINGGPKSGPEAGD